MDVDLGVGEAEAVLLEDATGGLVDGAGGGEFLFGDTGGAELVGDVGIF